MMAGPRKTAVRFRERSELLDFLLEVVGVTSETLDLDRLLAAVSTIVKKVIDCEFFAILLFNERTQTLRIRHSVGHRPELINHFEIRLDEGITGAAARSREAVLVGDVRKDARYLKAVDAVRTELLEEGSLRELQRGRARGGKRDARTNEQSQSRVETPPRHPEVSGPRFSGCVAPKRGAEGRPNGHGPPSIALRRGGGPLTDLGPRASFSELRTPTHSSENVRLSPIPRTDA